MYIICTYVGGVGKIRIIGKERGGMRYTRVSTKRNLEYFLLIFISIKFPDNDERNVITNVIDKLAIEEEEEKKKTTSVVLLTRVWSIGNT